MEPGIGNTEPPAAAGHRVPDAMPGRRESTILALDSLLTLFQLVKSEATLAVKSLPLLLALDLYRIPVHLLAWISFCLLAACGVQALTGSLMFGVGSFFLLQLLLTVLLEYRVRQLHARLGFPESKKGLALLYTSVKERFQHEDLA